MESVSVRCGVVFCSSRTRGTKHCESYHSAVSTSVWGVSRVRLLRRFDKACGVSRALARLCVISKHPQISNDVRFRLPKWVAPSWCGGVQRDVTRTASVTSCL